MTSPCWGKLGITSIARILWIVSRRLRLRACTESKWRRPCGCRFQCMGAMGSLSSRVVLECRDAQAICLVCAPKHVWITDKLSPWDFDLTTKGCARIFMVWAWLLFSGSSSPNKIRDPTLVRLWFFTVTEPEIWWKHWILVHVPLVVLLMWVKNLVYYWSDICQPIPSNRQITKIPIRTVVGLRI